MTENRKLPEAIQWHEGMLLSPQHFQQMDVRLEAILLRQRQHFSPYHWGVQHWEIDEPALAEGTFRILALEAVFPDGLLVDFLDVDDTRLEIDLTNQIETLKSQPGKVWIAIPALRGNASWTDGELPRYCSVMGSAVPDLNHTEDRIQVPRLRPNLSLHFNQPPNIYSCMPLAEITHKKNGLTITEYCAPCLAVPQKSKIWKMCKQLNADLRREIQARAANLKAERGGDPTITSVLEQKLHHLVCGLPQFEVMLGQMPPHPFWLYQSLHLLAGHLAALGESKVAKVPLPYDHNDPLVAFESIFNDLNNQLHERESESWVAIQFQKQKDHYSLHFQERWLEREIVIGVERGRLSQKDASRWLMHAVISLGYELQEIRERRMEGLARKPVTKVKGLGVSQNISLFALEKIEGFLMTDEELIVMPVTREDDIQPISLTLYIK